MERAYGWTEHGGTSVVIAGTPGSASQRFQQAFNSATVTVYDAGTLNLSTIYDDDSGTSKANPFTAGATDGFWFFYAASRDYDIAFSGIASPFTLGDVSLGSASGIPSYAAGSLPASGNSFDAGRLARVTDTSRGLWMDTGVLWFSTSGAVLNVKEFGATGDGVTDDQAAIQAALDAAEADGGTVYFPKGTYFIASTLTISQRTLVKGYAGADSVLVGNVTGSIITGTATSLVKVTSAGGWTIEDIAITESAVGGHASTIGLEIDNGATGVANWSLNNVTILGTASKLGIGIETTFGLKGRVSGCLIEGWLTGVSLTASGASKSNANHFEGTKIRVNTTGISVTGADNAFFSGCTIEGNSVGILATEGRICLSMNHLENNLTAKTNVSLSGTAQYKGFANEFHAAAANKDIEVTGGAGFHSSYGETLNNAGITHNGTGTFTIVEPNSTVSTTGTGRVFLISANAGLVGTNTSGNTFPISGFNTYNFDAPIHQGGIQVVTTRKTGWTAPTNTVSRASFDTTTVTLPQLAQRVKAIIDDLISHGLLGA